MKKILFYALAFCVTLGAGCSKDADVDNEVAAGKYTLPAITASTDDAETRTGLGTNQVVNWSNNDRIAVINTKSKTKVQYVLVSGAGTPIGKFEPVNNPATFDNIDDIKAVYPAIAASVDATSGNISVSLNKEYTEAERVAVGMTSWTANSSAYSFTNNDVKVSYNTTMTTSGDATALVNFKFRQLATWCNFEFDFNANKTFAMESMTNFKVTTTKGTKAISGTAQIDFTDPNKPTLKAGTETSIEWVTTGVLSSTPLRKSLMLFPVVEGTEDNTKEGDQLKVTIETDLHVFTFYATPSSPLSAGTVLRFPFNVDDNFKMQTSASTEDFTYAVEDGKNVPPAFYYYGDFNCILLGASETSKTGIDVAPHKTNSYYWVGGDNTTPPTSVARATYAETIWRESTMTSCTPSVADNKLSVTVAGYGNALVGIYDNNSASKKLLWSYHVWKPEIDVTQTLEYKYTNSGTYEVMPIALGATNKATVAANGTATNDTNLKSLGMYYQWGRKDPLGRPNSITAGADAGVTLYAGNSGTTTTYTLYDTAHEINMSTLLGGDAVTEKGGVKTGVYMLNYVTANPTHFIVVPDGKYNNDWYGPVMNDNLWGNPQGYNYPRKANVHRSVFDPCPKGYRVAPKDLWISFTKTGGNITANATTEANYAKNAFNILNRQADNNWPSNNATTTLTTQRGYFFCYGVNADGTLKWQQEPSDFYPASGYRNRTSGALTNVGSGGYCWSSSPYSSGSTSAGYLYFSASYVYPLNNSSRANGFPVRCVRE